MVPDSAAASNKPLVLIVEDEAALMTMLRYNLEKQGFRVEEAGDGEEALTRINELKPDMVPARLDAAASLRHRGLPPDPQAARDAGNCR